MRHRIWALVAGSLLVIFHLAATAQTPSTSPTQLSPEIEALLAKDSLLVDNKEFEALLLGRKGEVTQRQKGAQDKSSLQQYARALREAGALQWAKAEMRRSSPDGGIREERDSVASFRRAIDILTRVGPDGTQDLIDAKLRLSRVIAKSRCLGGDCSQPAVEAAVLCDDALQTARRIADSKLIARALRASSELQSGLQIRSEEVTGIGKGQEAVKNIAECYQRVGLDCKAKIGEQPDQNAPYERQAAWMAALTQCLTAAQFERCSSPVAPQPKPEQNANSTWEKQSILLAEALRLEPADSGWSSGRVETLVLLAGLEFDKDRRQQALPLLREAAQGFRALGLEGDNRLAGALTRYFLAILSPDAIPRYPYFEGERVGTLLTGRSSGDENEDCVLFWRAWTTTHDSRIAVQLSEILIKDNRFDAVEKIVARALRNDHVPADTGVRLRRLRTLVGQRRKADWSEKTPSRGVVAGSVRGLERPRRHAWIAGSRSLAARSVTMRSTSLARGKRDRSAVAVKFSAGASSVTERKPASKRHTSSEPSRIEREERSPDPVQGPSSRCDVAALRTSQNLLLAKERVSVLQALRMQQHGYVAFGSTLDVEPEERVFLPVVACQTEDPDALRASLERVLLRREVWHYRSAPLQAARLSPSPDVRQRAEKLTALRSVRSQLRLRNFEDVARQLEKKPLPHTLEWPADTEPVQATTDDLEFSIRQIEVELATTPLESSGPRDFETLWSQLLLGLGKDGALLAYLPVSTSPTETQVAAAIVTGDGAISLTDLGGERQIFHGLGESAVLDRSLDLGRELQRMRVKLFDPIERRLINKRRIFLLDSGLARFLPWSSVVDTEGRLLGDRFVVSRLAWVGDTAPKNNERHGPRGEVVLVAPTYPAAQDEAPWRKGPTKFLPLPEAQEEIDSISAALKKTKLPVRILRAAEGTEKSVRSLHSPQIVHFAAHGFRSSDWLSSGAGLDSPWFLEAISESTFSRAGIVLREATRHGALDEEDGLLTIGEAADLDFRGTSLVVLSSCETGLPTLQASGAAYDVAIGFRMAGAQAVVASLWRVDDRATRLLMGELYRRLSDGTPVVEALWAAKKALRREPGFEDPRYWAAFEVFGRDVSLFD
jgi:CHAT domain-containing protein